MTRTWISFSEDKPNVLQSGLYRIRWTGSARGVRRLKKDDPEAVFAIGRSSQLRKRRRQFERALRDGKASHSEGRYFFRIASAVGLKPADVIPALIWEWSGVHTGGLARAEAIAIERYIKEFGQLPPLNRQIPATSPHDR